MTTERLVTIVMFFSVACSALFGAELVRQNIRSEATADTVYLTRPPAATYRAALDSCESKASLMRARLSQYDDHNWREVMGR